MTHIQEAAMATRWIDILASSLNQISHEKDTARVPKGGDGVHGVYESTVQAKAERHIKGRAKKSIISAPPSRPMHVMGDNHDKYDPSTTVVSDASCNTKASSSTDGLVPRTKVVDENLDTEEGLTSTVENAGSETSCANDDKSDDDKSADHDNTADEKSADDKAVDDKTVDDNEADWAPRARPRVQDLSFHLPGTTVPGAVGGSWTTAPPHPVHRQANYKRQGRKKKNRFR